MASKLYHLNKIKIKTESDLLEFIDMVTVKLAEGKAVIKKSQMEKQSLRNRLGAPTRLATKLPEGSVLNRILDEPQAPIEDNEQADRLAQMRAAQAAPVQPKPGDIGQLNLLGDEDDTEVVDENEVQQGHDESEGTGTEGQDEGEGQEEESSEEEVVTPPSQADLTPIGDRVAGKAESTKVVKRRQNKNKQSLKKK